MRLGPDTYAVLRNTATLEAYRERQRRARRAGQPFLAIAVGLYALVIGAFVWIVLTGFHVEDFRAMFLPVEGCLFLGGVMFAIAAIRISLWLWAHPEAPDGRPRR